MLRQHHIIPRSIHIPSLPDWRILLAWLTVTCIWGTTYLASSVSLESFPALLTTGVRFCIGGSVMFVFLRMRGIAIPPRKRLIRAACTGILMVAMGSGASVSSQYYLSSGMTAVLGGTVPIWAALLLMMTGQHLTRQQWAGVLMGLFGIILINIDAEFQGEFIGVMLIMGSAAAWATGTIWKTRAGMKGGLIITAFELLAGGSTLVIIGLLSGQRLPANPAPDALNALIFLTIASSIVAYGAYAFLIENAPPALTTSYAYTAPLIAVFLGTLAGETLSANASVAILIIFSSVILLVMKKPTNNKKRRPATYPR
ncbi:MAG: EamA family transporter [Aggregatilineales bacterium]